MNIQHDGSGLLQHDLPCMHYGWRDLFCHLFFLFIFSYFVNHHFTAIKTEKAHFWIVICRRSPECFFGVVFVPEPFQRHHPPFVFGEHVLDLLLGIPPLDTLDGESLVTSNVFTSLEPFVLGIELLSRLPLP